MRASGWKSLFKRRGAGPRQIRAPITPGRDEEGGIPKAQRPCPREKPLSPRPQSTVPQTDTGGREEHSQANGRTREKELGKIAP